MPRINRPVKSLRPLPIVKYKDGWLMMLSKILSSVIASDTGPGCQRRDQRYLYQTHENLQFDA